MREKIQARVDALRKEVAGGNFAAILSRYGDVFLVGAIAAMVGMMIVPLPTWLLDILLTVNITAAVTVLMVSIYISGPTQIASYPTLLLITTLYRLSLDISATRLILLQADAGEVIRSFGNFVVQGNFVVGAVIFLIITLVQFIVITKGSERVAEVAARFTLDAMPGKQMSIDADMRAGIIDFQQARTRRDSLARESQFYGAMDGAMKFVKGDAIASIIITVVNIAGGLVIGVVMNGMGVKDAVQTYSILTIGNGLVSQIPALLISISAGMVVTRVASDTPDSNLGKDVASQIVAQPKAIAITAGLLLLLALTPGLPKIPFFLLAALTGSIGYGLFRAKDILQEKAKAAQPVQAEMLKGPEFSVTVPIVLNVSQDLTSAIDLAGVEGQLFYEKLAAVRKSLYYEGGVMFPAIHVLGNNPFSPGLYEIWLNEVPSATGEIRPDRVLVDASAKKLAVFNIGAEETRNPATGRPASWVPKANAERAKATGNQVWDTHEILLMHLTHFLRKNAREFIGVQEAQIIAARAREFYPTLVDELVPKPLSYQQLAEVLQKLVDEQVSIRDLKTIFQSLGEIAREEGDVLVLSEHVRVALKRKICYQLSGGKPMLFVYQLDPEIEEMFRNSVRQGSRGAYLAMDAPSIQRIVDATRAQIGDLPSTAQKPVVLTDGDIRRFVKRLLDYHFPDLSVLSYDQLTQTIDVQPLAVVSLSGAGGFLPN